MAMLTISEEISAVESALQAARAAGDVARVAHLGKRAGELWLLRRRELAAQTHTRAADWSRTIEPRRPR